MWKHTVARNGMSKPIAVLMIEDTEDDAMLALRQVYGKEASIRPGAASTPKRV